MAQVNTDGNNALFLHEQLAHLHTGNTRKKVSNVAFQTNHRMVDNAAPRSWCARQNNKSYSLPFQILQFSMLFIIIIRLSPFQKAKIWFCPNWKYSIRLNTGHTIRTFSNPGKEALWIHCANSFITWSGDKSYWKDKTLWKQKHKNCW